MSDEVKGDKIQYEEELKKLREFEKSQKEIFLELQKTCEAARDSAQDSAKETVRFMTVNVASYISKAYGVKVKDAARSARLHNFWFVFVVIVALVFAGFNCNEIREVEGALRVILSRAAVVLVSSLPVYAFLIWLAYIARKNSLAARRTQEAYTHKQLFGVAVEGLMRQIRSVDHLNEQKGAELMTQVTSALISSFEKDVSVTVETKNNELPIGEATDGVTKVINSVSELLPWKKTVPES